MKNITTIERIAMQKTAMQKTAIAKNSKDNSKNNNNCLAVFFGIIHFDYELKSPSSAGGQQIWFLRWVCGFGWLSGRQHKKRLNLSYNLLQSNGLFTRNHLDATDGPDRSDIVGIRALFSANSSLSRYKHSKKKKNPKNFKSPAKNL